MVQDAMEQGAVLLVAMACIGCCGAGCGGTGRSGAGCGGVWLGDIGAQPKIAMLQRALSHLLVTSINCQLFS